MASSWDLVGNAGNPTGSFLGTTDGQPLVVKTLGVEHLRVTADGKVGIGTANPGSALHVDGDVTVTQGRILLGGGSDGTSVISSFVVAPSPPIATFTRGSELAFSTFPIESTLGIPGTPAPAALERLRIDRAGSVGIGTSTPVATLDVRGQGRFQGPLAINNASAAPDLGQPITDARAAITFGATDTSSAYYLGAFVSGLRVDTTLGLFAYQSQQWSQFWYSNLPFAYRSRQGVAD